MTLIQVKRGTAAQWTTANPVLSPGEFGFETDTHKIKVGTGFAYWNDLGYVPLSAADIGLDEVDNTADLDKPVSTATQTALDGKADSVHGHVTTDITGLDTALNGKADAVHSHTTSDITGLDSALSGIDTALDGKADTGHSHTTSDITGLDTTLSSIDTALSGIDTALDGKEPLLVAGTTGDYYRGDKTWQTLNKSAVGLSNVDNTSDADKPVSTATQTALDGKEPTVTSGTTGQYYRGDKSWATLDKSAVGLGNVDNTSDATKNAASATLTNKTISGSDNTLSNIPQSAVTGLGTSLSGKEDTANKGQAGGYASLDGGGKVPVSQLPNSIMTYNGLWNAATNTPTLADGTGDSGDVYRVSTGGSQDFGSGAISFVTGDYVIYNGSVWEKADTTDAISSINGYTGNVTLTKSDVGLGDVDNTADAAKAVLSATKLTTARNINGVAFDGTANITVADDTKEPVISAGSTGQYWRGDKSWQTLNKTAVGLANVDNTADANKAVLSAGKLTTARNINGVAFDGTADVTVADDTKEPIINAGTTGQYYRGDKSWQTLDKSAVGLGNVDNTSDATKNSATATLTNKTLTSPKVNQINDPNGATNLVIGANANAVNFLQINNSSTGNAVGLYSSGTDTNVGLDLNPKGSGLLTWSGATLVTDTGTQSLTNKTLTNPTINGYTEGVSALGTVTSSATLDIAEDSVITATLTASTACTFTMPTAAAGKSFTLLLKQAASTGNGTATFTGVKWSGGTAPTITATAGRMDILTFFSDGVNWYGAASQNYTP